MKTKKWYVGQKFWDKTVSDEAGEIISINDVQLVAKFFRNQWVYSLNGELIIAGRNQLTLSTKPYEIKMEGFSQEVQEEELPKKGQICWGSNNEGEKWYIGHFVKKEFKNYILNTTVDDENTGGHFTIITTKNPYEVDEDREPQIGDMVFAWNEKNFLDLTHDIYVSYGTGIKRVYKVGNKVFKYCSLKNPLIK